MLLKLLMITFAILAIELLLFALFTGIGLLIRRAFGLRSVVLSRVFTDFWMGFSVVISFLLFWNFAFPVNGLAFGIISIAGICGLFVSRLEIRDAVLRDRPPAALLTVLLLAGLWMANISMEPMTNWDSGLYHVQAVKWVKSFAVVPGLANLHGPLAFNSASFLYFALLDAGPWSGLGYHFANGLLVLAFVFQALCGAARFSGAGDRAEPGDLFDFLVLACGLTLVSPSTLPSYVTDVPMNLILLVALSRLYRLLTAKPRDDREESYGVITVCTFLAVGISLKFSSLVFAALCWLVMVIIWARRAPQIGNSLKKTIGWATAIPLLIGLAWTGRGIVQSGYPLFPVPLAGFPVDWLAPLEHAAAEYDYIVHSGRSSVTEFSKAPNTLSTGDWFPDWVSESDILYDVLVPLGITVFSLIAWAVFRRRTGTLPGGPWWLLAAILPALVVWFSNAPDSRYAKYLFWGLAALCGSQAYRTYAAARSTHISRVLILGLLLLGLGPTVVNPVYRAVRTGSNPLLAIVTANLNRPKTGVWLPGLPKPEPLETFVTESGLKLYVPPERCWDAPLPCTANPAPNLSLRSPGNPGDGFVVNGNWQMRDWPYRWRSAFLPAWRAHRARTNALEPDSVSRDHASSGHGGESSFSGLSMNARKACGRKRGMP